MTPRLTISQGRIIRAIAFYLSSDSEKIVKDEPGHAVIVEAIASQPWSSLTFAGERHHVVVRLPPAAANDTAATQRAIDGSELVVAGAIVAVEGAAWLSAPDGIRLTLDLIAVAAAAD